MMRCDRRGDIVARRLNKLHSVGGGDVLEYDSECRESVDDRAESRVNERFLAVENVHVVIGDFAMDKQR